MRGSVAGREVSSPARCSGQGPSWTTAKHVSPIMGCWKCGLAMARTTLEAAAGAGHPWGHGTRDFGMTRGSPGSGACRKAMSCSFLLLLLPGLPLGLPRDYHVQGSTTGKKEQGFSCVPPACSPLCTDQRESCCAQENPPLTLPEPKVTAPPGPCQDSPKVQLLQTALQVPITHPKQGILLDGCGRITYHRKAR